MKQVTVNTNIELTFDEIFDQLEDQSEFVDQFLRRLARVKDYDFAARALKLIDDDKIQEYMESHGFNFVDDSQVEF